MKHFIRSFSIVVSSVFFVGYIPVASGTFGSLAALTCIWFLKPGRPFLGLLAAAVFGLGAVTAHIAEGILGKDSSRIVIDEFAGFLISVFSLPLTPGYLAAAFFLFRFFDILKPPPISNIERTVRGGLGVMLDDAAAGLAANLLLQIWRLVA